MCRVRFASTAGLAPSSNRVFLLRRPDWKRAPAPLKALIVNIMSQNQTSLVTNAHKTAFERDGFFVLENVVSPAHLQLLRGKVDENIARIDAEMEARGVEKLGINQKGSRYFVGGYQPDDTAIGAFIFSDLMAQITAATLGDNVYLFHEQYVVKAAEKGGKFSWHQDSGYVGHEHKPYLTCWVTLDDVNEENGTVYLLPYERAGNKNDGRTPLRRRNQR